MNKRICMLLSVMFLAGCVAFVNDGSEGRKVKSLVITEKETIDILNQTNQKAPDKEFKVRWPKK